VESKLQGGVVKPFYDLTMTTHQLPDGESPAPPERTRLLTPCEAQTILRISRSSLYRLFDSGELAWVQISGIRRIATTEIDRFIAAHTRAAS